MKSMVMYLQNKNTKFGRYIGYGCWCLAGGDQALGQPNGRAVDAIDRACRDYHHCNRCLQLDFPTLDNELSCNMYRGYRFGGSESDNGDRTITCNNIEGSCQNTICSCDAQLAERLAVLEDTWRIEHHVEWGGFDRDRQCRGNLAKIQPRADKCCGTRTRRFPFNTMDDSRSCCGAKTFWRSAGCCIDGVVRDVSQCANMNAPPPPADLPPGFNISNPFIVPRPTAPGNRPSF